MTVSNRRASITIDGLQVVSDVYSYTLSGLTKTAKKHIGRLDASAKSWVQLYNVYVEKPNRRCGFGGMLLEDVKKSAEGIGANVILYAQPYGLDKPSQQGLEAFYVNNGFKEIAPRWFIHALDQELINKIHPPIQGEE